MDDSLDCRTAYGAAVVWSRRSERFAEILKDRRWIGIDDRYIRGARKKEKNQSLTDFLTGGVCRKMSVRL